MLYIRADNVPEGCDDDHRWAPARTSNRWLAFGVVLAAAFMDLVDVTVVTIALPHIQADLRCGYATAQWVLAGYSLTFALALITGGRLGDIYGRKRIFLTGIVGFTLSSAACGAAASGELLVAARLLQGIFAALMVPQVMSFVMVMFAPDERPKAFTLYGAVLSLGNVGGPLIGALFVEYSLLDLGWRAIFYANVPLGVMGFLGALRYLPESRSTSPLRLDLAGVAVVSVASFALMYPLIQGREAGWPAGMILLLASAAPALLLFGLVERRRHRRDGSALVPPPLLRQRSFAVGLVVLLALFSGLTSLFLVLYYTLQTGLSWSPLRTALAGLGFPVGITLVTGVAQRFAATRGRALIQAGLATMTVGMVAPIAALASTATRVGFPHVALPVLVVGLGIGLCVSIVTTVVLADVPAHSAGAGSGVTNAVLQLGGAVGVAVVGTIMFGLTTTGASTTIDGVSPVARPAEAEIFTSAAATTLWYNAGVFLLALLLTPMLPRAARRDQDTVPPPRGASARPTDQDAPSEASTDVSRRTDERRWRAPTA